MADTIDKRKLTANEILETLDRAREILWPQWNKERLLVNYYNGGNIPIEDDECADDAPISLGLGYRYIKKPLESLLDCVLTKPGFVKTEVCYPLFAERKFLVERAADSELNELVHARMDSTTRSLCGRAMITGRGFLFRLSKWDWRFKQGRLIAPPNAPDDICDDNFREWGFSGTISLREIDDNLQATEGWDGMGWSHTALKALKKYILSKTLTDEQNTSTTKQVQPPNWDKLLKDPFDAGMKRQPLDVYWYFRKTGEKTFEGREKIDLYCVSRWGCTATVERQEDDNAIWKSLKVVNSQKEQIIYYKEDAFDSIEDCLIPMLLDSRIDGEQEMLQIEGMGKIMVPRLQSMEHITSSLLEGIAFGVQPNWTANTTVDQAMIENIQRQGLNAWDFIPQGLTVVQKSNSMQGLNQAMEMLKLLGVSAEADAQTGEISSMGESPAKFKAEANQFLQQLSIGLARRKERSFICLDKLSSLQATTLAIPIQKWRKADPGYYEAMIFQRNMLMKHRVLPAEYSAERMKAKCRRLAGDMERSQALQQGATFMQLWGGQVAPEGARFLGKEAARATWDDSVADIMFPDQVKQNPGQVMKAQMQNSMALVSLIVPPRDPEDNPLIHLQQHMAAMQKRVQLSQQAGSVTVAEREGMSALLVHMAADATAVHESQQREIFGILEEIKKFLEKVPLTGAQTEMAIKEQKMQLEMARFGFDREREKNLVQDRDRKGELAQMKVLLQVRQFLQQQKNDGVSNAAELLAMMDASSAYSPTPAGGESEAAPSSESA